MPEEKLRPILLPGGRVKYVSKENDPYYPRDWEIPQYGGWDDEDEY